MNVILWVTVKQYYLIYWNCYLLLLIYLLALIFEEAGGAASNGKNRILDMNIDDIHQRTPLFLGSVDIVNALEKYNEFYEK